MKTTDVFVNEVFLSKKSGITLTEIHSYIIDGLKKDENSFWVANGNILVSSPLHICLSSLPREYQIEMQRCCNSQLQEFIFSYKKKIDKYLQLLKLKLKWKFEETESSLISQEVMDYCGSDNELIGMQKKVDMFQYASDLVDRGEYTAKAIHGALFDIGLRYYKHEVSFSQKLKAFRSDGPKVFFNSNRGSKKEWLQKVTEIHKVKILELYRKNRDTQQITEILKKYSEEHELDYISRSTIKKIINKPRVRVVHGLERNGPSYIKNNVISYVEKEKPKFKLQVVECDGSRLQLPYRKTDDSKWKIGYLTLYVVMDVASNKILGFWVDDYENKEMVMMAFFMMLAKHKYLPAYIRIDRSKPHQSHRFKSFLSKAKELGMSHRVCYEPREKGTIENFFHWFPEKICKKYPIYTGLGPMVKSWDKKPNPETIESIEKSKKLPIRSELKFFIPKLIGEWNERPNSSDLKFPNRIHLELKVNAAILISEEHIARLTWECKEKKRFSRNTISFQDKTHERRSYKLKNLDNIADNFEEPLHIYWLESEPEFIYVFTPDGKFIEKANKKKRYLDDPINITDPEQANLIKEKNENYGMIRTIKNQVKESNQKLLDKARTLTPFSITSGLGSDKEDAKEIVDEFFLTHTSNEPEKQKSKRNRKNPELEKNIVETAIKTKYKYSLKNEIKDVE